MFLCFASPREYNRRFGGESNINSSSDNSTNIYLAQLTARDGNGEMNGGRQFTEQSDRTVLCEKRKQKEEVYLVSFVMQSS